MLFFVLGLVLGAIPLGILVSFLTDIFSKDAPIVGALIGGGCMAVVYVTLYLMSHSQGNKDSQMNELLVKHLLGLCFWSSAGFIGGAFLLAFLNPYVSGGSDPPTVAVGILGGFVGGACSSVGYIAYCRGGVWVSTNGTSQRHSTTDQQQ